MVAVLKTGTDETARIQSSLAFPVAVPKSVDSTRIWSDLVLKRSCESTLAARIQSSLAFPVAVPKSVNSTRIWSELVLTGTQNKTKQH